MGTKCLKQWGVSDQTGSRRKHLSESQIVQSNQVKPEEQQSNYYSGNHSKPKQSQSTQDKSVIYPVEGQINLKINKIEQVRQSMGDIIQVQNKNQDPIKPQQYQQGKIYQTEGLPNLGNTCFLNSAIQFLYSFKVFRKKIIKSNNNKGIQSIIKGVFQSIHQGSLLEVKQIYMKILIEFLQKSQIDYKTSSQQDCLQFMLFILNNLNEQDESYLKMFQIQYQQICHNSRCGQKSRFCQYFLQGNYKICPVCRRECQITFFSKPQSVIFLKYEKRPQKIKFKNSNNSNDQKDQLNYALSGQILYSGSSNNLCGHYISRRRRLLPINQQISQEERQKLYFYNDDVIQQENEYGNIIKFEVVASLYQFQQIKITQEQKFKFSQYQISKKQLQNQQHRKNNILRWKKTQKLNNPSLNLDHKTNKQKPKSTQPNNNKNEQEQEQVVDQFQKKSNQKNYLINNSSSFLILHQQQQGEEELNKGNNKLKDTTSSLIKGEQAQKKSQDEKQLKNVKNNSDVSQSNMSEKKRKVKLGVSLNENNKSNDIIAKLQSTKFRKSLQNDRQIDETNVSIQQQKILKQKIKQKNQQGNNDNKQKNGKVENKSDSIKGHDLLGSDYKNNSKQGLLGSNNVNVNDASKSKDKNIQKGSNIY